MAITVVLFMVISFSTTLAQNGGPSDEYEIPYTPTFSERLNQLERKIDTLINLYEKTNSKLDELENKTVNKLSNFSNALDDLSQNMHSKLDDVRDKLDSKIGKLGDEIENQISGKLLAFSETVDGKLKDVSDRMENKLYNISTTLDTLLENTNGKFVELGNKLDTLDAINQTINVLQSEVSCIKGQNYNTTNVTLSVDNQQSNTTTILSGNNGDNNHEHQTSTMRPLTTAGAGNNHQDAEDNTMHPLTTAGAENNHQDAEDNTMGPLQVHRIEKTWNDARQMCRDAGKDLVSIETRAELDRVREAILAAGNPCSWYWSSARRCGESWCWGDGDTVEDWVWRSGQPDGNGDCGGIHSYYSYKLYDRPCAWTRCVICEG